MSHVSMGAGRIRDDALDLQATKLACEHLGLVFCAGQTTHQWYGRWVDDYHGADAAYRQMRAADFGKCSHAIRLPWTPYEEESYAKKPEDRPYEAGLVKMTDGTFAVVFDHWQHGKGAAELARRLGWDGKDCAKLQALISQYKITIQAASQRGHYVKNVVRLDGDKTKVILGVRQPTQL